MDYNYENKSVENIIRCTFDTMDYLLSDKLERGCEEPLEKYSGYGSRINYEFIDNVIINLFNGEPRHNISTMYVYYHDGYYYNYNTYPNDLILTYNYRYFNILSYKKLSDGKYYIRAEDMGKVYEEPKMVYIVAKLSEREEERSWSFYNISQSPIYFAENDSGEFVDFISDADKTVNIFVNGTMAEFGENENPLMYYDEVYVPVDKTGELICASISGGDIYYSYAEDKVIAKNGGYVRFIPGTVNVATNMEFKEEKLGVPPVIRVRDNDFIRLSLLCAVFEMEMSTDENTENVYIVTSADDEHIETDKICDEIDQWVSTVEENIEKGNTVIEEGYCGYEVKKYKDKNGNTIKISFYHIGGHGLSYVDILYFRDDEICYFYSSGSSIYDKVKYYFDNGKIIRKCTLSYSDDMYINDEYRSENEEFKIEEANRLQEIAEYKKTINEIF